MCRQGKDAFLNQGRCSVSLIAVPRHFTPQTFEQSHFCLKPECLLKLAGIVGIVCQPFLSVVCRLPKRPRDPASLERISAELDAKEEGICQCGRVRPKAAASPSTTSRIVHGGAETLYICMPDEGGGSVTVTQARAASSR